MIEFHNDRLVPPELCRMLHQAVPKACHVPVRFHNRRRKDLYEERGRNPLGEMSPGKGGTQPAHIDVNLNPLYEASFQRRRSSVSAPSSSIWWELVDVCFHEFGHVATWERSLHLNKHEYHAQYGYGKVYKATERLADEWRDRRVARIIESEQRLGQPRHLTGY